MYDKTVWIDHIVDPNTGEVLQQGTRFDQQKMNNIENGIYDAHMSLQELEDSKVKEFAITLAADQWIDKTYTIQNSLLTTSTSGRLIMGVNSDQSFAELKAARISKSAVLSNGSLAISASGIIPTGNINLILQIKSTASNEFIIDLPSDGGDADTLGKKEPAYFASRADYLALLQRIEAAEENLNKKIDKNCSPQFFLPANEWDEKKQQTIPCDKFTVGSTIIPAYIMPESNIEACSKAGISVHSNTDTTITFSCSNIPSVDVVVGAMYQGDSDVTYEIIDEIGQKEITWYTEEIIPNPDFLLHINGESLEGFNSYDDKSKNKNKVTLLNGGTYKIPSNGGGYFKGSSCISSSYKSSYSVSIGFQIDKIVDFDITKPWQVSFSMMFQDSTYAYSGQEVPAVYFDGIGCGIKIDGTKVVAFYISQQTDEIMKETICTGKYHTPYHVRIMYKLVNEIWSYVYEIKQEGQALITKTFNTKMLSNQTYIMQIAGYVTRDNDETGSVWLTRTYLDDIIVRGFIEETHALPLLNSQDDAIPNGTLEIIKHTSIINISDNTVLRHNADGTVDKHRTKVTELPYEIDSNTIALLHCDELKATDEVGNAITMIDGFIEVDTEKQVFGTSSYKFNRLDIAPNCILTLPTPLKRGMKITFECYVYIDSASLPTGNYNNYLFTLANNSGQQVMHAFLYKPNLSSPIEIEFGVSTAAGGGGGRLIDYEYSSVDDFVDQWNHVAFTIDLSASNSKVILYVNGVEMKKHDSSNYIIWDGSFDNFYLGCYPNVSTSSHVGNFDEICITNGIKTEFVNKKTESEWVRL